MLYRFIYPIVNWLARVLADVTVTGVERMPRSDEAGFGFDCTGRARLRANSGGQADEIQALALERLAGAVEPGTRFALRAALECDFDETGITAVKAAQEMHRVGEIPRRVRARGFEKRIQMRMARATFTRNTGKLRFGNADRLSLDRPVNRHSLTSRSNSREGEAVSRRS